MVTFLINFSWFLAALFLVALNGFFVASEFALVRVRETAVDEMADDGLAGADTLQHAMEHLDGYLAATQLGITIASIALGWIGEPAVAALIGPALHMILPANMIHTASVIIGFCVVTFLHVVFGELAPKTVSIAKANWLSRMVAFPMKVSYIIFKPALFVLNGTANLCTSLAGIPPASETETVMSEEEIIMVLSTAHREGKIDQDEAQMIKKVFDLDDQTVQDAMVDKDNMVTIKTKSTNNEAQSIIKSHPHNHYPVINNNEVSTGYVRSRDILLNCNQDKNDQLIGGAIQSFPTFNPDHRLDDALQDMQGAKRKIAGVVNDQDKLIGLITVEDVVEVIAGQLSD